jgi:uncharacterized membrane protein
MAIAIIPRSHEAAARSLAKAVSWRITGTIDTFVISSIITGKLTVAGSIAATELFTKVMLYYFHERIWAAIGWGHKQAGNAATIDPARPEPVSKTPSAGATDGAEQLGTPRTLESVVAKGD